MLFLIDLDGTLIDSDHFHYEAWSKVLDVEPEYIEHIIKTTGMENYLKDSNFVELKKKKIEEMTKIDNIEMISDADKFIDFILENNINHAVVTHTDREVVDYFKYKVPILQKLENWVVREDYTLPKPDPECYKLAVKMYGKNDKNIIGFENSVHGLKSLSHVTNKTFKISKNIGYSKIIKNLRYKEIII